MSSSQIAEGPLFQAQRVEFPDGGFYGGSYVEVRQIRWPDYVGWEIEHGSLNFGHAGSWGRDNVRDAMRTFSGAVEFQTRTIKGACGCWNYQHLGHCIHSV